MQEVEILIGCGIILFFGWLTFSVLMRKEKEEKINYKNISQMAKNLATCRVSTRQTVLTELKENPDWSDAEVEELRGVLEGMLNTRITIHTSGNAKASITARRG